MLRRVLVLIALIALPGCGGDADDNGSPRALPSPTALPTPTATEPTTPPATAVASGVASDSAQRTVSVTVAQGKVTGDTGRVAIPLGSRVRITVTADVADEIHVHVYDLTQEISANAPGSIEFVADKPGVIEVELERAKLTLTRLAIS